VEVSIEAVEAEEPLNEETAKNSTMTTKKASRCVNVTKILTSGKKLERLTLARLFSLV
jgi:hypothetical protein